MGLDCIVRWPLEQARLLTLPGERAIEAYKVLNWFVSSPISVYSFIN